MNTHLIYNFHISVCFTRTFLIMIFSTNPNLNTSEIVTEKQTVRLNSGNFHSEIGHLNTQTGESDPSLISSEKESDFDFVMNEGSQHDNDYIIKQKPLGISSLQIDSRKRCLYNPK